MTGGIGQNPSAGAGWTRVQPGGAGGVAPTAQPQQQASVAAANAASTPSTTMPAARPITRTPAAVSSSSVPLSNTQSNTAGSSKVPLSTTLSNKVVQGKALFSMATSLFKSAVPSMPKMENPSDFKGYGSQLKEANKFKEDDVVTATFDTEASPTESAPAAPLSPPPAPQAEQRSSRLEQPPAPPKPAAPPRRESTELQRPSDSYVDQGHVEDRGELNQAQIASRNILEKHFPHVKVGEEHNGKTVEELKPRIINGDKSITPKNDPKRSHVDLTVMRAKTETGKLDHKNADEYIILLSKRDNKGIYQSTKEISVKIGTDGQFKVGNNSSHDIKQLLSKEDNDEIEYQVLLAKHNESKQGRTDEKIAYSGNIDHQQRAADDKRLKELRKQRGI